MVSSFTNYLSPISLLLAVRDKSFKVFFKQNNLKNFLIKIFKNDVYLN